jgi:hypothetical protein
VKLTYVAQLDNEWTNVNFNNSILLNLSKFCIVLFK